MANLIINGDFATGGLSPWGGNGVTVQAYAPGKYAAALKGNTMVFQNIYNAPSGGVVSISAKSEGPIGPDDYIIGMLVLAHTVPGESEPHVYMDYIRGGNNWSVWEFNYSRLVGGNIQLNIKADPVDVDQHPHTSKFSPTNGTLLITDVMIQTPDS
jgi:roadblock/LC7 domain-containing protein